MRILIASAGHTATPWHPSHVIAVVTALVVAALVVAVLKVIGRILAPRNPKSGTRSGLPYAPLGRRK